MKKYATWVGFWAFILLNGLIAYLKEHAFLSQPGSIEEKIARIEVYYYVSGVLSPLTLVFSVVALALFVRIRKLEKAIEGRG